MSTAKYTHREIYSINDACDVLGVIIEDLSFVDLIRKVYGEKVQADTVIKILENIDSMRGKVNNGIKEKKKQVQTPGKEIFFTKEFPSTEKSRKLKSKVKSFYDISNLRFPERSSTCHTDLRTMLYTYINEKKLRDDIGVRVDETMRMLAPDTFGDTEYILKNDRKAIPSAIMEMLK